MCETGPAKTIHVLKTAVLLVMMSRAFIAAKWLPKQDIQQNWTFFRLHRRWRQQTSELPSQNTIKAASHPRIFINDSVKISNHKLNCC